MVVSQIRWDRAQNNAAILILHHLSSRWRQWPQYGEFRDFMYRYGDTDALGVLRSFPSWGSEELGEPRYGHVGYDHASAEPAIDTPVRLTVAGLANHSAEGRSIAEAFVEVINFIGGYMGGTIPRDSGLLGVPNFHSDDLVTRLPTRGNLIALLGPVLSSEHLPEISVLIPGRGTWVVTATVRAADYANITLDEYIEQRTDRVRIERTEEAMNNEFNQGWRLSTAAVQTLKLMDSIVELADASPLDPTVPVDPAVLGLTDSESFRVLARQLDTHYGWITAIETQTDIHASLRPSGRAFIEEISLRRASARERRRAGGNAVLRWLYEAEVSSDDMADVASFSASAYAQFYGKPLEAGDVRKAFDWLKAQGLVDGIEAAEAGLILAYPTSSGERVAETNRDVVDAVNDRAWAAVHNSTSVNVSGSSSVVNVQSNSAGATQTATVHQQINQQIAEIVEELEKHSSELGPETPDIADGLRDAAQSGKAVAIKTWLRGALDLISRAGTTIAAGDDLYRKIEGAIHSLT